MIMHVVNFRFREGISGQQGADSGNDQAPAAPEEIASGTGANA